MVNLMIKLQQNGKPYDKAVAIKYVVANKQGGTTYDTTNFNNLKARCITI